MKHASTCAPTGRPTIPYDRDAFPRDGGPLWVFGYGSLIWKPGFPFCRSGLARVHGFHRQMCIYSYVHRGTPEHPGLVMGLSPGGSCWGVAFEVASGDVETVLPYLWDREMITGVYKPTQVEARLRDGERVRASTFVVQAHHRQYAGGLDEARAIEMIRTATGQSGACRDYLESTVAHLDALGVPDRRLHALVQALRRD